MDKLKNTEFFPAAKEDEKLPSYSQQMLRWLEKEIWYRISKRVNWLLDRIKDDQHEITKSGNKINEEGNWRFKIDGNDLTTERHNGSAWVTIDRWHGS